MRHSAILCLLLLGACAIEPDAPEPEPEPYDDAAAEETPQEGPSPGLAADAGAPPADAASVTQPEAAVAPASDAGRDGGGPDGSAAADAGPRPTDASVTRDAAPPPCLPTRWYRDRDADGYGDPREFVSSCRSVPGYVSDMADCYDQNWDARPGQTLWFKVDRGDGSFDYDCDGQQEQRFPRFAECPELDDACPPPGYWPEGFSCDYNAMIMASNLDEIGEGWGRYQYWECPNHNPPCSIVWSQIPSCGAKGSWGIDLEYNRDETAWQCTGAYNSQPIFQRLQTCR